MDKETAADTYKVVEASFNDTGIPTPEGIGNIIKAVKAEGRFKDRNIAFEEVTDPRFAIEVAPSRQACQVRKFFFPLRLCAFARDYFRIGWALPRCAIRGEKVCRGRLRTVARN
jgi:hypothetical protein